ncbi:36.4 kDa proline-rich protein [Brachypodium distachyon]|uniref:36.4 kDa proline-rich protein n=1 Tax=Brachypodium distachyon TaxID=15368 RepID=UPI0001C705B5|nr:36.4 kDa proline-rich protein [Brachypodium distachyon]|eukprot:XP_003580532.1 36.4 kDa proline-rich protein [Brachypodium distachyon]
MAVVPRIAPLLLLVSLLSLSLQLAPSAACPTCPTPTPPPPPPPRKLKPPPPPSSVPCPPPPYTPTPVTPTPSTPTGKCPVDTLKLVACVDALNGLVHAVVGGGSSASEKCCPLLSGVADLDAALCLCTTIKAQALDVSLVLPVAITVLVNQCGKHVPSTFQCPS